MNLQRVLEVIGKYDVSAHTPPLAVTTVLNPDGSVQIGAMLKVDSVATGRKGLFLVTLGNGVSENIDPATATVDSIKTAARRACLNVLTHEFDEMAKFDGSVAHDPHA